MMSDSETSSWPANARERIVVALDVESEVEAYAIAAELRGAVGAFKIGLQLFTAAGPQMVRRFVEDGFKIFLDLKFLDIPNTAANASVEAARLGVWMFNLHASGGREMMRRASEAVSESCDRENRDRPIMIGVTVLTSSDSNSMSELGIGESVSKHVQRLARLAFDSGLDGVVASAQEIGPVRAAVNNDHFLTVTPGIRSGSATVDDQKRVTTLTAALTAGSDYVVIGRPITSSKDRIEAVDRMLEEKISE
ncbi:orotidine-5'-phosphate decarboxylase [soil metagenome]